VNFRPISGGNFHFYLYFALGFVSAEIFCAALYTLPTLPQAGGLCFGCGGENFLTFCVLYGKIKPNCYFTQKLHSAFVQPYKTEIPARRLGYFGVLNG
jgi:hypothetical protein